MATKAQLQQEVEQLREALELARNAYTTLKRDHAQLIAKVGPRTAPAWGTKDYPLVDRLGRKFRMEGRIKVYPASN